MVKVCSVCIVILLVSNILTCKLLLEEQAKSEQLTRDLKFSEVFKEYYANEMRKARHDL